MKVTDLRRKLAIAVALLACIGLLATAVPAPSPASGAGGTRIVYVLGGRLFAVPPRGGTPRVVASVPANTVDVAAAADGRRFALIANRSLPAPRHGSVRTLYLLKLGGGLRRVRRFRGEGSVAIALSPKGGQVAFCKAGEIWVVGANGSHEREVTNGRGVAFEPAYTPDGGSLVFVRAVTATPVLYRTPLARREEEPLGGGEARMPAVSPDGSVVYLHGAEGPAPEQLVVLDPNGSRHTIAEANDPVFDLDPTFSPDGDRVAFLRLWEKSGHRADFRYSVHTLTTAGEDPVKAIGGLRGAGGGEGRGPLGPLWVPARDPSGRSTAPVRGGPRLPPGVTSLHVA
jgi:Tol biopolymer transport system component